jgi:hypothetical protein
MGRLHDWMNRGMVQLYKHLPWLADRWARRRQFVEQARRLRAGMLTEDANDL